MEPVTPTLVERPRTIAHYDNTGNQSSPTSRRGGRHGVWIRWGRRASATPDQICDSALCRRLAHHSWPLGAGRALDRQRPWHPHPRIDLCRLRRETVGAGCSHRHPGSGLETPIDPNTIVDGVPSAIGRREQRRPSNRDERIRMRPLSRRWRHWPPRGRTDACPATAARRPPVPLHLHRPERAAVHPQHRDRGAGCAGPQRRQRLHPVRGSLNFPHSTASLFQKQAGGATVLHSTSACRA